MNRFAEFVVRRRRLVLVITAALTLVAGFLGRDVADHLSNGGFNDPSSESSVAQRSLDAHFGSGSPNLVVVVSALSGSVDDAAVEAAARPLLACVAATPYVEGAVSYWTLGKLPPLRSDDGRQGLMFARITGADDEVATRIVPVLACLDRTDPLIDAKATGQAAVYRELTQTSQDDLKTAEMLSLPIILILLILVFGSVIAATLPVAVAVVAVVSTFAVLRIMTEFASVSVFSLNLATGLGLGLAIDYGLLVVTRYREELAAGSTPHEAVIRTATTAGRTVMFSAFTVAASLSALLLFPFYYLRSFAYAGIAVVTLSALSAIVVLPALLAVLGRNVDRWALTKRTVKPVGEGFWFRLASGVMRRPLRVAVAIGVLLVLLGSPFLRVHFGQPDDRMLPVGAPAREASQSIRDGFGSNESNALPVVAVGSGSAQSNAPAIGVYAAALSAIPGVSRVDAYTGSYVAGALVAPPVPVLQMRFAASDGTWLSVVPDAAVDPQSSAGERLAREVRALPAPFDVEVGGASAALLDSKASLGRVVPGALGLIALITFATLFLMFGSVVLPAKAVVLNLLSLTATFGAMVWVFQDGHLSGWLGFTPTGNLEVTTPVLMFCIVFGLSMDYEVFLLSRIKEEYDRGRDNVAAVAVGLQRTGGVVTAAAALMAVVFVAFGMSGVTFLKMFGVGLTMAVLVDATLIRGLLVPAFMRLAGRANWWAPRPLRWLHGRIGISEGDPRQVLVEGRVG